MKPVKVKRTKMTWEKKPMSKAHPNPKIISKGEREKWVLDTGAGYLLGIKYSYTDYEGKKKTGSQLIEAKHTIGSTEAGWEKYVDDWVQRFESGLQMDQVRKLQSELIIGVNEYQE